MGLAVSAHVFIAKLKARCARGSRGAAGEGKGKIADCRYGHRKYNV